jgi:hypothetical protein
MEVDPLLSLIADRAEPGQRQPSTWSSLKLPQATSLKLETIEPAAGYLAFPLGDLTF